MLNICNEKMNKLYIKAFTHRYKGMKQIKMYKTNKLQATLGIVFLQTLFFMTIGIILYSILTLNVRLMVFLITLTLLQRFISGKSQTYINFVKKYLKIHDYLKSINRIYQEPIPEGEKVLFAFCPHGIFTYAMQMNMNLTDDPQDKISNMNALGSRFVLNLPFFGLHFKLWGIGPIDPENVKKLMKEGVNIGFFPGGYEEATITTPNQMRIFIQKRKGFIKYALKYGYTIRPLMVFNQHRAYQTMDSFLNLRLLINKLKIPAVIFWSQFGFFLPPDLQLTTIIGRGIRSKKPSYENYQPTTDQIDQLHQQYKDELIRMYEKHKHLNGNVPIKLF